MLKSGAQELGLNLTDNQINQFEQYLSLLLEYNQKFNLTAITNPNEIVIKHFLDSLTCSKYIPEGASVIDVGTGAGFPGIPLKIVRPDISITLIDALKKRVGFLETVVNTLGLRKVKCLHMRAEDAGKSIEYRGKFDCALSRAVAKIAVLAEYNLPLVKVGGVMISMKGKDVQEEINEGQKIIDALGGDKPKVNLHTIPFSDITHSIVEIHKKRETPKRFPRINKKIGTSV